MDLALAATDHTICIRFVRKILRASLRAVCACHENDVEDIVQDAYAAYLDHLAKGTVVHSPRYFWAITRFLCYRYMRGLPARERHDPLDGEAVEGNLLTDDTPETEFRLGENEAWRREALTAVRTAIVNLLEKPDWKQGMPAAAAFTEREKQVLELFLAGHRFKEIGYRLGISLKTAHTHYEAVCRKIGASHPVEVVKFAIREQLISP